MSILSSINGMIENIFINKTKIYNILDLYNTQEAIYNNYTDEQKKEYFENIIHATYSFNDNYIFISKYIMDHIDLTSNKIIIDVYILNKNKYISKQVYKWLLKDEWIQHFLDINNDFRLDDNYNQFSNEDFEEDWLNIIHDDKIIQITPFEKYDLNKINDVIEYNIIKDLNVLHTKISIKDELNRFNEIINKITEKLDNFEIIAYEIINKINNKFTKKD